MKVSLQAVRFRNLGDRFDAGRVPKIDDNLKLRIMQNGFVSLKIDSAYLGHDK